MKLWFFTRKTKKISRTFCFEFYWLWCICKLCKITSISSRIKEAKTTGNLKQNYKLFPHFRHQKVTLTNETSDATKQLIFDAQSKFTFILFFVYKTWSKIRPSDVCPQIITFQTPAKKSNFYANFIQKKFTSSERNLHNRIATESLTQICSVPEPAYQKAMTVESCIARLSKDQVHRCLIKL